MGSVFFGAKHSKIIENQINNEYTERGLNIEMATDKEAGTEEEGAPIK